MICINVEDDLVRDSSVELPMHSHVQSAGSPAHNAVDGWDWTCVYKANGDILFCARR